MSEKTIRTIFIVILFFLPVQYIIVGIVGYYQAEPWPAFVFPGFKNVHHSNDHFIIRHVRFEIYNSRDEIIESIAPHRFFNELPRSQIAGFIRTDFNEETKIENFSVEAKKFLYERSMQITNQDVGRFSVVSRVDYLKTETKGVTADSTEHRLIGSIYFSDE